MSTPRFNDRIKPNQPFLNYGRPGTSMDQDGFSKQFGKGNTSAGAKGEVILFNKMRNPKNPMLSPDIPLFCSMRVPGKSSDIDFAAVLGNKILLIDAKMFGQDGGFYWSLGNPPVLRKNLGKYRTRSGRDVKLSKSMIMAKNILQKQFPDYDVEAIVVFVTDPRNPRAKQPNTMLLNYPGNVKAFNERGAKRFMKKFFRGQNRTVASYNAEVALKKLVQ